MGKDKREFREILRRIRSDLTPQERTDKSQIITTHLMRLIPAPSTVLVYASKAGEVETSPLIQALIERGTSVVVPIIIPEGSRLRLSHLSSISHLVPSTFGVPEPCGHEIPASGEEVDIALIPLLGFDRNGGRLGYGGGYYDRFLSLWRGIQTIGIGFSCQEITKVPRGKYDIRMDQIVTEEGLIFSALIAQ